MVSVSQKLRPNAEGAVSRDGVLGRILGKGISEKSIYPVIIMWKHAAARTETTLLLRNFDHLVRRMKDLLEYRNLLGECLHAVSAEIPGRSIQND